MVAVVAFWAAAAGPVALQLPMKVVWRHEGRLVVPIGDEPQRVRVEAPAVKWGPGQRVLLRFRARLLTQQFAGWNEFLAVAINGRALGPRTCDGRWRLVNRRPIWRANWRGVRWMGIWRRVSGYECMTLWFSHTWEDMSERVLSGREELYWYVLDITDAVRSDGPNVIEFVNAALRSYWPGRQPPEGMVVEQVALGVISEEELEGVALGRRRCPELAGMELEEGPVRIVVAPSGAVQVRLGGDRWTLEAKFRVLSASYELAADGAKGWLPAVRRQGERILVEAWGDTLRLRRIVWVSGGKVMVADRLINPSGQDRAVLTYYTLTAPESPRAVRLAGVEQFVLAEGRGLFNPTAHLNCARSGMGVVLFDDFMRRHWAGVAAENFLEISNEHFALPAGGHYTFRIGLYPALAGAVRPAMGAEQERHGYWAFLNRIRREIGVNFRVEGPFEFVSAKTDYLRKARALRLLLERKPIRLIAVSPWFRYYTGALYGREEYARIVRPALELVRKTAPGVKCLALVETNLRSVRREWFRGTLPEDWGYGHYERGKPWGKYGIAPPEAAIRLIEASPWADSMLRDEKGRPLLDTWYVLPPYKYVNLMVYPRDNNYRLRELMDYFRFLLDELGFDGIYIDQFAMGFGRHSRDDGRWDGHSVDVDLESGRIVAKWAAVPIVSASARARLVRDVLRRGKVMVANGPAASWKLQRLPIWRFMETQGYNITGTDVPDQPALARGQLGSPVGLGYQWGRVYKRPNQARLFMRSVVAHLRYGLTYYYYATSLKVGEALKLVGEMFPITPVQLGPGYIVGRERIVTCVSGAFKVAWKRRPKVEVWDEGGRHVGKAEVVGRPGAWLVRVRIKDLKQVAVVK